VPHARAPPDVADVGHRDARGLGRGPAGAAHVCPFPSGRAPGLAGPVVGGGRRTVQLATLVQMRQTSGIASGAVSSNEPRAVPPRPGARAVRRPF